MSYYHVSSQLQTPLEPQEKPQLTGWRLAAKSIGLTMFFLSCFLLISVVVVCFYAWQQLSIFTRAAEITFSDLTQTINQGLQQKPTTTQNVKVILVLGVDSLRGRGNALPLTDTMMLVALNLQTGVIKTVSLPRDLWSDTYQTKINALYAYGIDRYPGQPERFPTEAISELAQIPIHHTLVVTIDSLKELIDLVGGVEVAVSTSFIDTEFPRSDVDITTERDPAKLYMTVQFEAGPQVLTGERALQFIRSRHSGDDEGDDVARARRQQQVVAGLLQKLTTPANLKNPLLMGNLYLWYANNFAESLSMPELIATVRTLVPVRTQLQLQGDSLGVFPENETGLIMHPSPGPAYLNQWVYSIRDPQAFPAAVQTKLGIENQ